MECNSELMLSERHG